MTTKPRCKNTTRRCLINKKCLKKGTQKRPNCNKGSRKCYDQKCYKIKKSGKSRRTFYKKYGTTRYVR
jgi:hypothetical protein